MKSLRHNSSNWTAALNTDPNWIVIETWNEMHEGTPICRTTEFGDLYINLTAQFSTLFHSTKISTFKFGPFLESNWEIIVAVVCMFFVGTGAIQYNKDEKKSK